MVLALSTTLAYGQEKETEKDKPVVIKEMATEKSYGRKKKNHIKVGSIRNGYVYISQLTGPNGEKVETTRLGSCCEVKSPNAPFGKAPLDMWEVKYEGLAKPIILYLNGYDYEQPKCPVGLSFQSK